jgi:outer membrane protein assembly factor BamA
VLSRAPRRVAFVTYYKGNYSLHTQDLKQPLHTAASADFGAPGPIIDFQAPLQHTLVAGNKARKRPFEKLFLAGRPPINVGVSSGGDVFGGTQVSFGDVLGDQQFDMYASSISQYRTLAFSYLSLARRFQFAMQGFSQTLFYYGQLEGVLYDPAIAGLISRDMAVATQTVRGGSLFGIYPFNRYSRIELSAGVVQYREQYNDPALEAAALEYQKQTYGASLFSNGTFVPLSAAFVQETTVFREFGPLAGSTMRLGYEIAPKIGKTLSRYTGDADARYYLRLGGTGLLALRARGFKSWGVSPDFLYFGGNSEMRGYDYLEFLGQKAFFGNAELRFPLIELMRTPIGVMGGIRGVFYFNIGGAGFHNTPFTFYTSDDEIVRPVTYDSLGNPVPGNPQLISGFRLRDGRASYGIGLETFALGFPIHFDWSWRTLFNKQWEDVVYASSGGSVEFRKPRFNVWIGYDF